MKELSHCLRLDYVIDTQRVISLDLFEAEYYDAALVVQPLVGNLVYSNNFGVIEPRLASSWERAAPNIWKFEMRRDFSCENGEKINPRSFKKSLERMIRKSIRKGGAPVLTRLKGYAQFVAGEPSITGITTTDDSISFVFDEPLSGGLLEVLSFAPYGYISDQNFNGDGQWRDACYFISSGPYRIRSIVPGVRYELELREEWRQLSHARAPETIVIKHQIPSAEDSSRHLIIDTLKMLSPAESASTVKFELTPEYLVSALMGNLKTGFFSQIENRQNFVRHIVRHRDSLADADGPYKKASSFFSKPYKKSKLPNVEAAESRPAAPLLIEGDEPSTDGWRLKAWEMLKPAVDAAGYSYRFNGNKSVWSQTSSPNFDLRLSAAAVGVEADPWGIEVLFCSMIGPQLPDPDDAVRRLMVAFESEKIDQSSFESEFLKLIEEQAAIVPLSHYGRQLYMSSSIDRTTIGSVFVVMRFDQLGLL